MIKNNAVFVLMLLFIPTNMQSKTKVKLSVLCMIGNLKVISFL